MTMLNAKDARKISARHLVRGDGHLPDTDDVVGVTSEQSLTVSRPSHGQALGWNRLPVARSAGHLWLQLLNHVLALQVPDLDDRSGGGAQPVAVGREAQGVDDVIVVQGVQVLAIVQVPEHGLGVLAAGGAQGTVGRHGDGVQVSVMANVVGLELAVLQRPNLDHLVPSAGNDDWVLVVWREPDARDPVVVGVLLDGVLALGKGVPQLDGPVAGARHDLPVVGGEGHAEDLLGVALEAASAVAGAQVPQPQGVIPRAGQSEVTVGGQDDVGDEVPVTSQPLLGVAVLVLLHGELPDNQGLVSGAGQDHIRVLGVGGDLGHPPVVPLEASTQYHVLTHLDGSRLYLDISRRNPVKNLVDALPTTRSGKSPM